MDATKLSPAEKAALSPKEYRLMVRRGEWPADEVPEYTCEGYTKHAVDIVPKDYAYEFLLFCTRNPRGLLVSDVCEPGSPHNPFPPCRPACGLPLHDRQSQGKQLPDDVLLASK